MLIGKVSACEVFSVPKNASIFDAARTMKQHHVNCIVVVNGSDLTREPIGLISDNDIAIKAVAEKCDVMHTPVSQIIDNKLLLLKEDSMVREVLHLMSSNKTQRGVILNKDGRIIGLATATDLLIFISHELVELAEISHRH